MQTTQIQKGQKIPRINTNRTHTNTYVYTYTAYLLSELKENSQKRPKEK